MNRRRFMQSSAVAAVVASSGVSVAALPKVDIKWMTVATINPSGTTPSRKLQVAFIDGVISRVFDTDPITDGDETVVIDDVEYEVIYDES